MTLRLDRIVTRSGDGGMTSLGDATRVSKDDTLVEAMGTLDELNAVVGLVRLHCPHDVALERIQNFLFDVGAVLCIPGRQALEPSFSETLVWLESEIATLRDAQEPLSSFVLPGGTAGASWAHMARTVTRRTERRFVSLKQPRLASAVMFLNRLSDYFFVFARHQNDAGRSDRLWQR